MRYSIRWLKSDDTLHSAIQSDMAQPARAASPADTTDESKTLSYRQMPNINRLSALIQETATKGHRKVFSEDGSLAMTPGGRRAEVSPRRTRSAVLSPPPDVAENEDTKPEERRVTTQIKRQQRTEDLTFDSLVLDENHLGERLRIALKCEPWTNRKFLPKGRLDSLITLRSVERELSRISYLPTRILKHPWHSSVKLRVEMHPKDEAVGRGQTGQGHGAATTKPDGPYYKLIFAILLLIDRPKRIWSFVREQVCDADLPLEESMLKSRHGVKVTTALKCLKSSYNMHRFMECQWYVLAPVFRKPNSNTDAHLQVSEDYILPFTVWIDEGRQGGFAQVYRAEVHPDHHEFDVNEVTEHRTELLTD